MHRRKFIIAGATATTVAIAGCAEDLDDEDDSDSVEQQSDQETDETDDDGFEQQAETDETDDDDFEQQAETDETDDDDFEPTELCLSEDLIHDTDREISAGDTIELSSELEKEDELFIQAEEVSSARPKVELFDDEGNSLLEEGPSENIQELHTANEAGYYHIEFENEALITTGEWNLRVTHRTASCDSSSLDELSESFPLVEEEHEEETDEEETDEEETDEEAERQLNIIVTGEKEGNAVQNAEVSVIEPGGLFSSDETIKEGTTDGSGEFLVDVPEGETLEVSVTHDRYFEETQEVESDAETVEFNLSRAVFEKNETFTIDEEDVEIIVTDTWTTDVLDEGVGQDEADGIFRIVRLEVDNIGDEEISIGHNFFDLIDENGVTYDADSGLSTHFEHGISGIWEDLNPGISTTIEIGFDIPEDREIPYLLIEGDTGWLSDDKEYRVELE